ncbi:FadR/GntR family transcriptional regulator [Tessaracoccus antarcticus]|uniref:FadR family transcriptional regulator n=1 Tax=Tessaracoccus antarcticus TaxID=2479848 RepID=A0A3M0GCF7_9ACTN|nr:GntR family transcriptional regulator [Tessaracoccus antarcticus]RMB58799.1 FadR family transcriptional regulator [Tessaracoccus antarcticus]
MTQGAPPRQGIRASGSLANEAAREIKRFILSQGLRTGDPLPSESELCDQLGVSRSSVREAIRTLQTLDIVEVQHGRGTFVGSMSLQPLVETLAFRSIISPGDDFRALREVVDVRMSLDLNFAQRIVGHFAGTRNEGLHALVDEMVQAAKRGESFAAADRQFHTQLLRETGREMVSQLVAAFWDVHTAVLPQLSIPTPDDIELTARAHGDVLDAAEAGDVEAYCIAVKEHYAPLLRVLDATDAKPVA